MQLVLLCVLVLSLLQPGLLQEGGTVATPTNGESTASAGTTCLVSVC